MDKQKPRSRKKRSFGVKSLAIIGGSTLFGVVLIASLIYFQIGRQYKYVFFPNTMINGIDASKMSVEEVKNQIASGIADYKLTLIEREGRTEEIKGSDIRLESVFDGSLEKLLAEQKPIEWAKQRKVSRELDLDTMIQYDENQLNQAISRLICLSEKQVIKPEDATISEYKPGEGYHIIPAKEGNQVDPEMLKAQIIDSVLKLKPELSLEEEEIYEKPSIPTQDPGLISQVQTRNKYANVMITYTFGNAKNIIDGNTISHWIDVGADGNVFINSSKVTAYVKELASKYDTFTSAKRLKTSSGETVKVKGGSYGWKINQSAEADELAEIIRSGKSQVREPVYQQTAASRGAVDYGDTYVEINLTAQHLYFYKNGRLLIDSDFVSGNESKGWSTPVGVYSLTYKQKDATLKGENYSTPVSYWMPFNGNVGMHDATWRKAFGGSIYKAGGSHGCINLPPGVAKTIFQNITAKIPVLCYNLPGTESKKTSTPSGKPIEPTEAPTQAPTQPTSSQPTSTQVSQETKTNPPQASDREETTASTRESVEETTRELPTKEVSQSDIFFDEKKKEIGPGAYKGYRKKEIGPGAD
ncbi:L,D-transpeptidase family protein [Clostridium sp. E02]|uniref:L,D-transpeptidase family protein n=1 Tax=Clostridium sp. E02 TaxID=2487134 RepID=UPI000F531271|nr:L,D-transpeptidase family protein [Clostridium sp. E02]